MFGKKLDYVLTDCDGTICDSGFDVAKDTVKSIVKYQRKSGYRFSFITGRLDVSSKKIAKQLKIQLPVVSCNGALITNINTGEFLHAEYIDKTTCIKLFEQGHELGLDLVVYQPGSMVGTPNSVRMNKWKEYKKTISKKYHFPTITYSNLQEIATAIKNEEVKPVEIIFYTLDKKIEQKAHELFKKYLSKIDFGQSLPGVFNIVKKNVNKLSGLKHFAKIIGVDYQKIVTFGDNYNDIEMTKGVTYGYAVNNAVNELKKVAYQVIGSVEQNGVGQQLEKMIEDNNEN
ncbi:HAD family hydrolase [Williamsoniiplasma somnilux]|uniref:HAD family hydrolase n=1 Tax=Williamsoniiplasma somnilux TaxID=215578 RepID=A0A2K8NY07_9MOLU|nr:Cof-type HAD-IIB family hydrolase [Williamsoniiplasma somnilux]ATZ18712.1 HAD family hydrolase [Williamsoniiplasma somnilux]